MSYERLRNVKKTVGAKQTIKAVQKRDAKLVFLAKDAEAKVVGPIRRGCLDNGIPVEDVESMQALGKACGIGVGCAAAAILEE